MKSIGELKSAKLERASFEDIFVEYSDITPELRESLDEYLSQFVTIGDKCIKCGVRLNALDNIMSDRCHNCGYPHIRNHEVEHDGEAYKFRTLALQLHPSELRG